MIGQLVRHDHVHVDLIVNGKKVTIPAGVGLAEPVDRGPCQPVSVGDCGAGHLFTAAVANSPLHTHGSSGLIHVEPDRPGTYTLGQFFDEWGVRLNSSCVGGYCTGNGKELRAYVDGHRVSGDPRRIVLTNHQEIAIVFGGSGDFGSVPSTYNGRLAGPGLRRRRGDPAQVAESRGLLDDDRVGRLAELRGDDPRAGRQLDRGGALADERRAGEAHHALDLLQHEAGRRALVGDADRVLAGLQAGDALALERDRELSGRADRAGERSAERQDIRGSEVR